MDGGYESGGDGRVFYGGVGHGTREWYLEGMIIFILTSNL